MGFFTNQMLSNIQWTTQSPDTLVWKFPDADQVLQKGSTVIVGPGQAMLFVNDGKPAGAVIVPGSYDLSTNSFPFFSSILAVFRGMDTKHKAKIFFVNLNEIPNVKWGTKSPIQYSDPIYKFPVGLRAFGNYSFKITDVDKFFTEFVGDRDQLTLSEFQDNLTDRIIQPITDSLATASFAFTEIAAQRDELSKSISEKIVGDFVPFGFTMKDFRIENTDFDEETQKRVGSVSDQQAIAAQANALAGVDEAGYARVVELQKMAAMKEAAANPGGIAGMGVGMGVGVGMGANMASSFQQNMQQPAQPQAPTQVPPTPPTTPPVEPQPPVNPTQGA